MFAPTKNGAEGRTMQIIETKLETNGSFTRRSSTSEIILHHAEASSVSVETINRWHLDRGWTGIGYHYYIRKDGKVYRGRPEWAVGAHAVGHNSVSIGICCEGAYMTETMPQAQLEALKALIRDVQGRYGNRLALKRHKDVNSTDCPGDRFPWAAVQNWKGEPELTEAQVRAVVREEIAAYQAEQEAKSPSAWASAAWERIKGAGVLDGTMPRSPLTREQYAVTLERLGLTGR